MPPGSAGVPPATPRERGRPARNPPGARASRPHPYSCQQPPIQPTPLQGAPSHLCGVRCHRAKPYAGETPALPGWLPPEPHFCKQPPIHDYSHARSAKPPLRGSLPSCQALCGRDARAPGWAPARILIPASSLPSTPTPMQGAPSHLCGVRCHRAKPYAGETPALPDGLPPASSFLQAASHPAHSHARCAKPPLRGSLPSCQALCGRDARAPGRAPARILIPASSLPSTPTPLQGAPSHLCGVRCHRARPYAGETPALPGGLPPASLFLSTASHL